MSNGFSASSQVFSWLSRYINYESGHIPPKIFRLESMAALTELADHPERCAPVIHIAGSKGKGSVTAMLASMLEADGRRAARYMSPHISDFRERICLGNAFFNEAVYCTAGDELRELAENKVPACGDPAFDPARGGDAPSFFELLTMHFFLCARAGGCDVMVVETGLGGRLDATNIVDPEISLITCIELEHIALLGNTIASVAGEKAGIIKSGKPLVLAGQCAEALEVFKQRAAEKNSPLYYFPDHVVIEHMRIHQDGTNFMVAAGGIFPAALELSIPLPGAVQAENAALAVLALKTAFPGFSDDSIRRGLQKVQLPARFEKILPLPLIIDGAHTPHSAAHCAETFCSLYGTGGILLFGCAADKDAAAMAKILVPCFSLILVTRPGPFKISDPQKAYRAFSEHAGSCGKLVYIEDTGEAIRQALAAAREKGLPALCIGSFYLASEAKEYILCNER